MNLCFMNSLKVALHGKSKCASLLRSFALLQNRLNLASSLIIHVLGMIHVGDLCAFGWDCWSQMVSVQMDALSFKKMDFTEFCAAAISVHQLEGTDRWEQHARAAYDIFEKEGNRVISVEELARVRIVFLILVLSLKQIVSPAPRSPHMWVGGVVVLADCSTSLIRVDSLSRSQQWTGWL